MHIPLRISYAPLSKRLVKRLLNSFLGVSVMVLGLGGCVDIDGPIPKPLASNQVLAQVEFTSPAVMMVLDDTVQLTIRAIAMDGSEIPADPLDVKWRSLEPTQVSVDSLGRVVGREQSTVSVDIIATYRYERTTKADTIPVYVTATRLDATSIRLIAVDSTHVGTNGLVLPRVRVDLYRGDTLVMEGAQIPILAPKPVEITYSPSGGPSLEPVFSVDNKSYFGRFWIKAAADLYGNPVADSIEFTGIYPAGATTMFLGTDANGNFNENEMPSTVPTPNTQTCALVAFLYLSARPIDVVFSDSTASPTGCAPIPADLQQLLEGMIGLPVSDYIGGNVLNLQPFSVTIRRSNTEGVVSFHLRDAVTKERIPVSYRFNQILFSE